MLAEAILHDPIPPNWLATDLPKTWPDHLDFKSPRDIYRLLKAFYDPPKKVEIPDDLPGRAELPRYLFQEFHRLPNGNYSHALANGYVRGFEIAMLGYMARIRKMIAQQLQHCASALDVGCGGGGLAGALKSIGIPDVWGIEPSPYLLKNAAGRYAEVNFVQGIAERLPFRNGRFEAIGACFLFHELPQAAAEETLREFHRVLPEGGLLAIAEPSPNQLYETSLWKLIRQQGWLGPYFKLLAHIVYEPYVDAWHRREYAAWFSSFGFRLLGDEIVFPARHFLLERA